MFFFLTLTGILLSQTVGTVSADIHSREKVHVNMTVDKSANQPEARTLSDDAMLIYVYEQFQRPIHSYAYRLLGSQEDADDITQEVFVRACTSWDGLYERDRLSSWLYRIATNLCVDLLRRRKRFSWWSLAVHIRRDDQQFEEATSNDLAAFLSDSGGIPEIAERDLIRQTLAQMPTDMAVVLVLHAAQGIPYQEIAEIVGTSPNAAATRISRARKMFARLYQHVSKDGVDKRELRQ